jgi:hypothetical protein
VEVITEEESPLESETEEINNEGEVSTKVNVLNEDIDNAIVPKVEKVVGTIIDKRVVSVYIV